MFLFEKIFTRIGTFSLKSEQFQLKARQCVTDIDFTIENKTEGVLNKGCLQGILRIGFLESKFAEATEVLTLLLTEPDFGDFENLSTQIRIISSELAEELVTKSEDMAMLRAIKERLPTFKDWNELDNVSLLKNAED